MNVRGVDFVMFSVTDLAAASRFYREILGLPQRIYSEPYQWAEFDCGNVTLALKGGSPAEDIAAGARLALSVEDIHAAHAELKAQGVAIVTPPKDEGCCQHLLIRDPDGHVIVIHHRADGTFR